MSLHAMVFAALTGTRAEELLAGREGVLAGSAIETLNGLVSGHVYPLVAPKDAPMPYIVYGVPASNRTATFCGGSAKLHSVDISCWASTLELALEIRDAAIEAMAGLAEGDPSEFEHYDRDSGGYCAGVELRIWR